VPAVRRGPRPTVVVIVRPGHLGASVRRHVPPLRRRVDSCRRHPVVHRGSPQRRRGVAPAL